MTRPLLESEFQRQVLDFAVMSGWQTFHVRAGRTIDSWRTPGSGTMAKGWPDLVLVKGDRLIFAELKRDGAKPTAEQEWVGSILDEVAEYHVWRPSDWSGIEAALGRKAA